MDRPSVSPVRPLPVGAQWGAILFALTFPSVFTWAYFVALSDPQHPNIAQHLAYEIGKGIQFLFPAFWVLIVERRRPVWAKPTLHGMGIGIALGLSVAGIILATYFGWLGPAGVLRDTAQTVREKLAEFGIDTPQKMIGVGIFYSVIHSLLEEYYWRWFTFGQLRQFVSLPAAIAISGVGFMGHHVIVLWFYLPHWAALFISVCVGVGGGIWAWLYERTGLLYAPWISHLLIDAAIFTVGYEMVFAGR